jgi:hypothetical protein
LHEGCKVDFSYHMSDEMSGDVRISVAMGVECPSSDFSMELYEK